MLKFLFHPTELFFSLFVVRISQVLPVTKSKVPLFNLTKKEYWTKVMDKLIILPNNTHGNFQVYNCVGLEILSDISCSVLHLTLVAIKCTTTHDPLVMPKYFFLIECVLYHEYTCNTSNYNSCFIINVHILNDFLSQNVI